MSSGGVRKVGANIWFSDWISTKSVKFNANFDVNYVPKKIIKLTGYGLELVLQRLVQMERQIKNNVPVFKGEARE